MNKFTVSNIKQVEHFLVTVTDSEGQRFECNFNFEKDACKWNTVITDKDFNELSGPEFEEIFEVVVEELENLGM